MNKKYLPIGSIVKLKNKDVLIMVTGYYSVEYEKNVMIYDYSGCLYPEGLMVKNGICSFNHSDIDNVIFKGYESDSYNTLVNNFDSKDTLEEKSIDLDNIEDLFGKDTKTTEEFEIPLYKFDENGIIIN